MATLDILNKNTFTVVVDRTTVLAIVSAFVLFGVRVRMPKKK